MHKFLGVFGGKHLAGWEGYWQPTLTFHDPNPPITLENAPAAAADQPQEDPDFFNEAGALEPTPVPSGFQTTAGAPNAGELDWQWNELEQDYQDLTIEAAVASAPVVVNQPPEDIPLELLDQPGDDVVIDLAQATWPVEAQAPPFADPDDLAFGQEVAFSPVLIPSGFQTTDGAPNPDLVDFHDEEIVDGWWIDEPISDQPADQPPPYEWPFEEQVDLALISIGYQSEDAPSAPSVQQPQDPEWEWDGDTHITPIPSGYQTADGAPAEAGRIEDALWPDDGDLPLLAIPDVYQQQDGSPRAHEHDWDWDSETHITPIPSGYQTSDGEAAPVEPAFDVPWFDESDVQITAVPDVYQQEDAPQDPPQDTLWFDDGDVPLLGVPDVYQQADGEPNTYETDPIWWDDTHDTAHEIAEESAPVGPDGPPPEEPIRDLGARWPIYYIHRFRRIRKLVKSLPAAEAIARELERPAGEAVREEIARLREELARRGVEWQDQYARILAKERARAERLSRIQREDELAVLLMLDLLT